MLSVSHGLPSGNRATASTVINGDNINNSNDSTADDEDGNVSVTVLVLTLHSDYF